MEGSSYKLDILTGYGMGGFYSFFLRFVFWRVKGGFAYPFGLTGVGRRMESALALRSHGI